MFPDDRIQMVSCLTNPKGVSRSGFSRADEYIFFVMLGASSPVRLELGREWSASITEVLKDEKNDSKVIYPEWTSMMRRGSHSSRSERPGLYYAIYANPVTKIIEQIGEPLSLEIDRDKEIENLIQILPIRSNGNLGCWQVGPDELKSRIAQGRVRLGKPTHYGFVVNYLPDGAYNSVLNDGFIIEGRAEDGSLIAYKEEGNSDRKRIAPTQWKIALHNSSEYGSTLLGNILQEKRFSFPKSLYAVQDTLRFFVAEKPNALILDFFAGSGTTLHAVNMLNAEDGGKRRCIIVTNNEVSDDESKELQKRGFQHGDEEWERLGIARYVTWPRTVCSIEGNDVNGNPIKGNYLTNDRPMAEGFKANVEYFKLDFLDKNAVALGRQFREILPLLWMKAGAKGECPELTGEDLPDMLVLPRNKFAVLIEADSFDGFAQAIDGKEIEMAFIVTDSRQGFETMRAELTSVPQTIQLYKDYLDNFRITNK